LTVTGELPAKISLVAQGSAGNYSLQSTVTGLVNAKGTAAPTGAVSFLDTSNNNVPVASVTLGAGTETLNFVNNGSVNTGAFPGAIAVADFNGDGNLDLGVANYNDGNVTILLGNGAGSFTPATNSPVRVGAGAMALAVGDLNGDGTADLAVANHNDNTVTILLGNGDGSFTQATNSPVTVGTGPMSLAVGDLSGDGTADLVVANVNDSTVTILLGNGNGTFTQAANSPISVAGASPTSVAMGDFNRDGIQDVAVAIAGPNDVSILLGNGDGTFTKATGSPVAVGETPYSIAVGDLNGDGIADLVTANNASVNGNPGTVTVLLGRGDGSFAAASGSPVAVGTNPLIVAVGDLNADGKADLAVTNEVDNTVSVLLGNGDGTFTHTTANQTPTGFAPWSVALADFNGDGGADLAVGNSDLLVGNSVTVYITEITESATVTATGVSLAGAGTHLVEASYPGDSIYLASVSGPVGLLAAQATPVVTVTPSSSSITTVQALSATVAVSGGTGNPTPTGTVTLTSGAYTSAATTLTSGSATINIPAGALAVGIDTLTASYTPDAASSGNYNSASGSNSVTVTAAGNPGFGVSGTPLTVTRGASSGNTSIVTVTPVNGFTGSVSLTAAITSGPAGAQNPPTLSFGTTSPVAINGSAAGTATLTISTTAATSASFRYPEGDPERPLGSFWHAAGGTTLAFVFLFGIPKWRRKWRTTIGLVMLVMAVTGGMAGCTGGGMATGGGGSGDPGTTAGSYTVTVTGTSGATTATNTITLTVQ
jgi:hypothetical protein